MEVERTETRTWMNEDIDISDHVMIGITCGAGERPFQAKKGAEWKEVWNLREVQWEEYGRQLEEEFQKIDTANTTVDEWERKIKGAVLDSARKVVGVKKLKAGNVRLKGWWDDEVKAAIRQRKELCRAQRQCRKRMYAHGEQHRMAWEEAWEEYTREKISVQRMITDKISKWEQEQANKLSRLPRSEREREGWKRLRGGLGKVKDNAVKLKVQGHATGEEEEIRKTTENYWKGIIQTDREGRPPQDIDIVSERKDLDNEVQITREDVARAMKAMKDNKAAGTDGIIGEFLKNGGNSLVEALHRLFTTVWENKEIPMDWKDIRVTLIHKGGGKAKDMVENYRPISIINVCSKVFCTILNDKIKKWGEESKIWGEEQSGFRKGRGGIENIYVLKHLIEKSKRTGGELYLAFLDMEKAYDMINRSKMYRLLRHIGINRDMVDIIEKLYLGTRMKFTLGHITTGWVENDRGVRQGCVMSPTLFNIYVEELLARIRMTGRGVRVGDEILGCLAYADDIVLIAEKKEDLEELIGISESFGRDWDIKFSERKCKVLVISGDDRGGWSIGGSVLEVVESYKYLGMEVSTDGIGGARQRKLNESKARKVAGMIYNCGNRVINKYETSRCLWKGVGVPHCLYGAEVTAYREEDCQRLEVIQNSLGRWGLGLPRSTAREGIRGEMGWSTVRERVAKAKLGFQKKVEQMEGDRWAKRVWAAGGVPQQSRELDRWKRKENVAINWENLGMKDLRRKVEERGLEKWKAEMVYKSTLKWYRRKERPQKVGWHTGDWGSRLMAKARLGVLEVNGRQRDEADQACRFCGEEKETEEHVIVECDKYDTERQELIDGIRQVIGEEEWDRRLWQEEEGGIVTALGLYNERGEEQIIKHMKVFLTKVWQIRQREAR